MPLISSADVERLNNHAFRAVINALLTAEADLNGVKLTDLDLTFRDTDPDEGVDGHLVWPVGKDHDELSPGTIVVQYKSGKHPALRSQLGSTRV